MLNIDFDALDPYLPEWLRYMRDKRTTMRIFQTHYGRSFDWDNPKRFSEKIQVAKINPAMEKLSSYVDKWEVREYVRKTIGESHLIKSYGCFDSVDEIDIDKLPDAFIIKPTHGSGWYVICNDKKTFNWETEKKKLTEWLHTNFYFRYRERQYRPIKPRIIIEENLQINGESPDDFKIFCFDGKPLYVEVVSGRFSGNKEIGVHDLDWSCLWSYDEKNKEIPITFNKPDNLSELLDIATRLARPFPHVRVDLYSVKGTIYFSELTFSDSSGLFEYLVGERDILFGSKFNLKI